MMMCRSNNPMRALVLRFVNDQSAVTAMEYAVIGALISVVIVGAVTTIGTSVTGLFQTVATAY
jgi:pilus assembly protein Flp/PilA